MVKKIDIDQPKWDQSNYQGRAKHFLTVTNPLNLLASSAQLERAREIVHGYKKGQSLKALGVTEDELWKAKYLYDSAFHPDTGEKMILVGRMSAQVPMNMTITGCMLTFYRSTPAVIFWQWVNQSFNAIVNYTNRSGKNPIPVETLGWSYVGATTGAVVTALGLNKVATRFPPLVGRLVPLCAVAAANCVNIPMMRYTEIRDGIELQNEKGEVVGRSKKYAVTAISLVAVSRIMMAIPGMTLGPVVMNYLDKKCFMVKYPWSSGPIQMLLCGFCLTFATPLACAIFAQRRSVKVDHLEPEVRDQLKAKRLEVVYYNKGL